jgi:type VI secretion system protein ImpM
MARMLMASRSALGAAWRPAWLEAPVWRFALAPGICGPDAAIGLWMPSVDRIGRYFPLTIAAVALHGDIRDAMREGAGFLAAAEEIGRDALARDLVPDEIAAHLADAATRAGADPHAELSRCSWEGALWWTKGAPRVPAGVFASTALPGEEAFAAMLSACALTSPAFGRERSR